MLRIYTDVAEAERTLLRRRLFEDVTVAPAVQARLDALFGPGTTPQAAVERIIAEVRARGDEALRYYSRAIDGVALETLAVSRAEIEAAYAALDAELIAALRLAAEQIERFHRKQTRQSWIDWTPEGALGQLVVPLERVGVYVPGGTAPLPSSLLMAAIPARVAGVEQIVVCSPPQRASGQIAPVILVAADIAGVDAIYKLGGAQAIAALAFGTASVPRVDKIVGPGNLFVVLAKRAVYGVVDIEALPGPTETLVIADSSADPQLVAADLLAQAEHDTLASAILLTDSSTLAAQVQSAVGRQLEELSRADVAAAALARQGGIVVTPTLEEAFRLANAYAPEHLCLLLADPWRYVGLVRNAGGIFLGERSFEVLGDYVAGPSHVMPTGGTARYASPLNVDDFRKIISLVGLNEAALQRIGPAAQRLAEAEGLTAHAAAVRRRLSRS
ncbi:histidinol dehydrogenase [Kallotenue papyrolyticum]|uniref:histidinol dehydrogenase n=1 Tax=Kallotenue papyrolyticum TaxID=1325125 RepID=UPI000472EF1D|nr:histidinol dehydrogenase [Kallotenue papyrolyticum]